MCTAWSTVQLPAVLKDDLAVMSNKAIQATSEAHFSLNGHLQEL
jgi:hypothetical protein